MTTGFDIAANPQSAVAAVKAITRSFEELQRKVREVNGDLNKLSPEIRNEAAEANRRLSAVINGRMGKTFQQGLGLSQQAGVSPLMIDPERVYPSSRSAGQRTMQQMARVVGIPTGGPPGGGGGESPEEEGSSGGGMSSMAGAFGMAKRFLPLLGITAAIGTVAKGLSEAQQQAVQTDALYRTLGKVGTTFEGVQSQVEQFGKGLGMAQAESVKFMQAFASVANITDAVRLREEGRQAAGLARSFGMSPEQMSGPFASMRFLGQGGAGSGGSRELAIMIAETIGKSGLLAKSDEVVAALSRFTQTASTYLVEAAPTKQFADLYAMLNATGKPGLMGQNAENLINRMDASFRQGGGSEASKVFMWRALGESDPYKFRYDMAGGMLNPESTPLLSAGQTPLDKIMKAFKSGTQGGSFEMKAGILSDIFGGSINPVQAGAIMNMNLGQGGIGGLSNFLKRAGIDISSIQPDSYKLLGQISQGQDLDSIRDQMLKDPALNAEQRDKLRGATPDNMQDTLGQVAASMGRVHTLGSDQLEASKDVRDAILKLGDGIIKPIQSMAEILAGSLGLIAKPVNSLFNPQSGPGTGHYNLFDPMGTGLFKQPEAAHPLASAAALADLIDAVHNPSWVLRQPGQSAPVNYVTRDSANEAQPAGQRGVTVQ